MIFSSKEKGTKETELLVFITPIVVDNQVDTDRVNEPFRERLNEQRMLLRPNDPAIKPRAVDTPAPPSATEEGGSAVPRGSEP